MTIRWLAHYEEDGEVFFRIGRDDSPEDADRELIAEWIGLATLTANRSGNTHRFDPAPEADPREVLKVRRGGATLLLRHLRGLLSIHGAAVASGGMAVVLLGRASQGKSTLAAALCSANDVALLSDDAVAVDHDGGDDGCFVVTSSEEMHWLDKASQTAIFGHENGSLGKHPFPAREIASSGRLVAIVDLSFEPSNEQPLLERLGALEAMTALIPQMVRFVLDEPEVHRREVEVLAELIEHVPTYRLKRPRDLSRLAESTSLIRRLLKNEDPLSSKQTSDR